jgi:hypothetical protein
LVVQDSVLIAFGQELSLPATGRTLTFGMTEGLERPDSNIAAYWERVEETGGTSVIIHGRSPRANEQWKIADPGEADGWEVFDVSEQARRAWASPWGMYHLGSLLLRSTFDGMAGSLLWMDREGFDGPAVAGYDSLTAQRPLTAMAGLNHHPKTVLLGRPVPHYNPFFQTLVNHVVLHSAAGDDPDRELAAIEDAIRAGEVFIAFGAGHDADGFRVAVVDAGGRETPMGGRISVRRGLRITTSALRPSDGEVLFRLVKDGEPMAYHRGSVLSLPIEEPGVYRVEVYRYAWRWDDLHFALRPWIFANPIYVTP